MHDKTVHGINIRNLKQELKYGLVLEKVNRVIKFYQNVSLKTYIDDMNTDLRKKAKNNLEKDFLS